MYQYFYTATDTPSLLIQNFCYGKNLSSKDPFSSPYVVPWLHLKQASEMSQNLFKLISRVFVAHEDTKLTVT